MKEADPLEAAKRVVDSLVSSEIPRTLHLKSKWCLIASHLTLLQSNLQRLSSHPLSLDLLHSISGTLSLVLSLSHSCQSPSLHLGKLFTQSLLHSVLSSLHRHVSDSQLLLDSGILTPSSSSSCTKSKNGSVRSLIMRLQIGSADSKNSAMDSLLGLLDEEDKNIFTAISLGIVPALLTLLDTPSSDELKEKAVSAISRVSAVDSGKQALLAEGLQLLSHLLRVVESGSGFGKLKACTTLRALTFSKENARTIAARGGTASLLEICVTGMPKSQASAAGVLRNLAAFPEVKDKIVDEGAVSVLFAVLSSGTAAAQEDSIGCLCNLVRDDEVGGWFAGGVGSTWGGE